MTDTTGPNEDQIEWWEKDGAHWVVEAERYDSMTRGFFDALFDAVSLLPGERVLDIGCGGGTTSLFAARRVQPGGTVLGVDISPPLLDMARERAARDAVGNVAFQQADAQIHDLGDNQWDAAISKFGVMFFDDPDAAFANIARALRRGGRLAFVAWQDMTLSEWIAAPGIPASAHVGLPDGITPDAPGPYGLADHDRTVGILEGAGLTDVHLESVTLPMRVGDDIDDALAFFRSIPFVQGLIDQSAPADVERALDAARQGLEPHAGPDGVVMHNNSVWLATARRA